MPLRSDQKALMFVGAIVVLGAGVRVVRAASQGRVGAQPALDRQQAAADSAARASRVAKPRDAKQSGRRGGKGRSGQRSDSLHAASGQGPLDRRGHLNGKLDLDVATAAQIDSLPGVGPSMARRIVLDRMAHGPFVTRDGLRRVAGAGPILLARIDSLVTFSGTVVQATPADTAMKVVKRKR